MHRQRLIAVALVFAAAGFSQRDTTPPVGSPLAGLSPEDAALFAAGKADFLDVESPADGLGQLNTAWHNLSPDKQGPDYA